jgi:hypothetical protein
MTITFGRVIKDNVGIGALYNKGVTGDTNDW